MKGTTDKDGYVLVVLSKHNTQSTQIIHRLVAQTFIPNDSNKLEVNHIDEDKTNNHISNLEWVTRQENINYGTRNKRVSKANSIPIIATNIKTGESTDFYGISECARKLGLYQQHISAVLTGKQKQTKGYTFKYKEV